MSRQTLKQRLDKIDCKMPTPRRTTDDDDSCRLFYATVAADWGVNVRDLFRASCPVLASLHEWCDGTGTQDDAAVWHRIGAVDFFPGHEFTTADYLRAVSKMHRYY